MIDLLKGLNEPQQQAVQTTSGPLLILAGAGSGKTKTLTHRIAYLIAHEGLWPSQILAVTFTNKAAREMRERLGQLLGESSERRDFMPWMGTFHGICVRLLRMDGQAIGISRNFVIYDEDDRQSLIKQAMKQLGVSDRDLKASVVSAAVSRAKNDLQTPDDLAASASYPFQKNVAKLYAAYEKLRVAAGALDFDDLLLDAGRLLRDQPDIRQKWRQQFRHILIDEYQDTNAAQYQLVKLLINDEKNICVVGDDWQCLVEGSLVETLTGPKKIELIKQGDQVRAATGYGKTGFATVTAQKSFAYKDEVIKITTASGKVITTTPNHLLFARWQETTSHFVYLMHAKEFGYRIGVAKGSRFDGKKWDIGLRVRANQERADRMWVLEVCKTREEALYQEAYYAYKYGIPMMVFHAFNERSMKFGQEYIDRLYQNIDTVTRAQQLMADKRIAYDYPHFAPQATIRHDRRRVNLNVVMFGDKRTSLRSPWSASRLSLNTSDEKALTALKELGYTVRPGKAGTFRVEIHNQDYGKIETILDRLRQAGMADSFVTRRYAFMTDQPYSFMPAAHIHPGMVLPGDQEGQLIADEVIEVETQQYEGKVYDLDVQYVHNYVANGIAVHNSIYSWRGADFTNILNFERDFPGTSVIKLEQNYRSSGSILEAAHNVISKNVERTDKKLWTAAGPGAPVTIHGVYDEAEEARLVADRIASHVAIGARHYGDFAVLYRTNAQSYTLERAFLQQRVPYQIIGGVRFYDRKIIKDVVAYLRLLYQPNDRMSFSRIANVPTRGIGAVSLDKFLQWQSESGQDIITALGQLEQASVVSGKARQALINLGGTLQKLQSLIDTATPTEIIEQVIERTGYRDFVLDGTPQAEDNEANLGALLSDAQTFATLDIFLEEVALMSSADDSSDEQKVTLMTLHAAKGLEFPVVFMVGLEEGILPHARVFESGASELEEERRLCYVGMTRAREELHLSYANSRLQFGQRSYNPMSRFISDMGSSVVMAAPTQPSFNTGADDEPFYSDEFFAVGDRVRSAAFGTGEITDVDGLAVTIHFDSGQSKKLNAEYARLEKL